MTHAVRLLWVILAVVASRPAAAQTGLNIPADLAQADLLVLVPPSGPGALLAERRILEALGTGRGLVLSFAILGRSAEDSLGHFQMGHVTADELRLEANVAPAEWSRYKPLLDLALARQWPVVPAGDGAVGPETERAIRAPNAGARPLVVYIARPDTEPAALTAAARKQLPGARVFSFLLADRGAAHPAADYVLVP